MATNPFDKFDDAPADPNPFDKFDDPNYTPSGAFRRGVADKAVGIASGAVGLTKAVADAAGANNVVSRGLAKLGPGIDSALSPEAQADQQEQGAIMDEAKGKGTWEQVKAGARAFGVAPVQTTAQGAGSAIPFIAASLAGAPVALATGLAAGVGTIKGSIFDDQVKRGKEAGMSDAEATAAATKAQEYSGPNQDQIALGGALGAADAMTGVSRLGGAVLRNAMGKPVTDVAKKGVPRGVLARSALGAAEEMPLEAAQGGQEQYATNVAANRAGYKVDPFEGVASNATLEALASAGPGAGFGALHTGEHGASAPGAEPQDLGRGAPNTPATPPGAGMAPPAVPPRAAPIQQDLGFPPIDAIDPNANATPPTARFDPATAMLDPVPPASVPLPTIDPTMGPISLAASKLADAAGVVSAPDPVATAKAQEEAKAKSKGKDGTAATPKPVPPTPVATTTPAPAVAPAAPAGPIATAAKHLGVPVTPSLDQAVDGLGALFAPKPPVSSTTGETQNAQAAQAVKGQPEPAQQGAGAQADAGANQDVRGDQGPAGPIAAAAPADGAKLPARTGGVNVQAQFQEDKGPGTSPAASAEASPGAGPETGQPAASSALATTDQVRPASPDALTKQPGLSVTFAGKTYPVESIDDAQRKWIKFSETSDAGGPAGMSKIGNGVRVTDQDGNLVAKISYNGRAWDGEGDGAKVIAEAPRDDVFDPSTATPLPVIDDAAHNAATSPRNQLAEPTDAQKEAGNYPKGHVRMSGMDLSIENPEGSVRKSKADAPVKWQTTMKHHYGYIKGTIGNDKDHVDVFIKPGTPLDFAGTVFVVDQIDPDTGKFDEHKVMIGFDNPLQAKAAYQANYAKGWKGMKAMTPMSFPEFKTWVYDGPKNSEVAAQAPTEAEPAPAPMATDEAGQGVLFLEASEEAFSDALDQMPSDPGDERLDALFQPQTRRVKTSAPDAYSTPEQAAAQLAEWKAEAKKQGKTGENANRTVLSLFDFTGEWAKPWAEAGYNVITLDLQNLTDLNQDEAEGSLDDVKNFSATSLLDEFGNLDIWAILSAPPCTDFASSGAHAWKAKDADGRTEASNHLVRQVLRTIELFRPPVWAMENPVGRMKKLNRLPEPLLTFNPNAYGDPYTKKTQLWGNFNPDLPANPVEATEGSKITEKLSSSNKIGRSQTPEGFAYAFFMANNALTGFTPAERLAQEFHGIEEGLFADALVNHTEADVRSAIQDGYYDGGLDIVRDTLADLAVVEVPDTSPLPAMGMPTKFYTPGQREYTTKEAQAEWDKKSQSRREAITHRIPLEDGSYKHGAFTALATKNWDEQTPAARKVLHVALNEDFYDATKSAIAKGIAPDTAPIDPLAAAGQAWGELTPAQKFSELLSMHVDGKNAEQGKYITWANLAPNLQKEYAAKVAAAPAPNPLQVKIAKAKKKKAEPAPVEAMPGPSDTQPIQQPAPGSETEGQAAEAPQTDTASQADQTPSARSPATEDGQQESTAGTAEASTSPDGTPDPAAGKWYGTKEKADAKLASLGLADTHEVVRDGMRFELRKKKPDAPAAPNPLQQKIAESKSKKADAPKAIVKGEIGMKLEAGQIVTTSSGRQTTPFPKVDMGSNGKANNTIKRVDAWLISNALAEAQSRGDTFNERQFQAVNNLNPTQSDKDSAEEYLFGEQPKVVPSILKPLVTPPKKPVTPQIPNDPAVTYGLPTFASNGAPKGNAATWDSLSPEWRRTKLADAGYTDADQARVLSGTPWNGLTESVRKALDKNWGRKPPEPVAEPAPAPTAKDKPSPSANTIFTEDAAAAARARLKAKLGRLSSGLDPETMLDGITLAGYHIEKGARTFAAYAKAMLEDLGGGVKPYLKSWYMGVRYDPRASGFDGMSTAAEVDGTDIDALEPPAEKADTAPGQPTETLLGANNDTGRNAADDRQLLDDAVPRASQDDGQGGDPAAVDGLRTPDPAADGRPADDRSGRGDGLDGDAQPVLPGSPAEIRPLADSPVGRTEERPDTLTGENPGNFEITFDLRLGEGTDGQKIKANLDAIRTLRLVQKERRFPTNEEQRVMARYVGWGGLKTVFDPKKKDATDLYGKAQRELRELLNPQEYRAANGSIRNAHYTAQGIVEGMWRVARHMGFKGGRVLEPTVGIGNFIGLQPKDMAASSEWHASELDTVTGQMAALLYPEANVLAATGFQDAPFADDAFDLVIGNPPFGQQTIDDKNPNRKHLSGMKIHNYIIAKSGMHLRPGGVMSLVVTHRFLDTANPEARDVLASDFKFLGAFRLPNNAFAANAGTEVVTDVIFLQKLRPDEARDREASWLDVNGKITVDGQDIRVNRYYQDNPTHILGRSATDGTMYGGRTPEEGGQGEYTVHGDGRDLGQAIDNLITGGFAGMAGIMERTGADMSAAPAMLMQSDLPVGGVMLDDDGKIRRRELDDAYGNAVVVEITPDTLWKEQAAEWQALQTSLRDIRERAKEGRVTAADAEEFLALARFTFKSDGTMRSKPTKAEAAVYKLVDALARPADFKWTYDDEGLQIGLALARKQLGTDGYKSLKGMLDLRNRALRLIRAEQTDDPKMEDLRADLTTTYDAFVKANGFLSDPRNSNLLDGDIGVEAGLEASFNAAISAEVSKSTGVPARKASATKADILKQRVNFPYKEITVAATSADALSVSLSERGKVDLPYMAKITGKSILGIINELSTGENPQLFRDPETNEFQEAERYLSGNVRHKLEVARERNETANIKALEKVQPEPKTKSNVTPNIRGMWVPEAIFTEFLQAIGYQTSRISILASQGIMTAEGGPLAITDFGTQFRHARATAVDMFNAAVAGKPLIIYDPHPDGRVRNDAMTKEVTALVDRMAKVFQEWAYSDDRRANAVVAAFNEKMNTHVKRTYDGVKYLRQVGASPSIKLRRTQKNAAWRMIQEQTMLADHVVGAGKTFTLITGIMERRRMGLSRKPMVAVPNHLVVQWARDFYKLYPSAKVLAATPADFARKNRRRLLARIATGDYDAIIIGHSSLGFIETPADDLRAIVDEKLAGLRETMEVARANKESKRTLGQIEDRIERYEARLEQLAERPTDEIGIDFKSMGIDHLSVDEAHEFKNLEYSTSGDRVKGMNDPNGSKKAFDLYSKARGLLGRKGGLVFATGTPVSNSLVEIYTVMSYLAHDQLVLRNQDHFDSWSGAYASTETRLEYTSTQKLKPARVLAGLNNLSALRQLYEQFADIITMADLKRIYAEEKAEENKRNGTNLSTDFPIPRVRYGARQLNSGPVTTAQQEYMDYLVARMTVIEQRKSDRAYPAIDNPLNVLTDARKMSLDIRIVDPTAPRDENGKVMRAAKNIKAAYDASDANRGTQLVFCDLSTPAKTASKEAKRMVTEALTVLVGEKQVKANRARLDGMSFEKQWARLREAAEKIIDDPVTDEQRRDQVSEYFGGIEDAEATMLTADIGFSVYDDMRTVLMEMGIPESEIAFIHDYNTPEQKEKLFDRVNNGYIRVLMGSTMKMGAGTNAQRRMVALHHMDAPWRPSDVEQREGRIIRQGNLFATLPELMQGGVNELYDPEFEVGIDAYSTENTSDTVMWQVLERKAGAIEQFRAGGLDSTEEEGADSNQYAEFMASSTGNPVFRLKLEAERRLTELTADISGALITRSNAASFMQQYESRRASDVAMRDAAQAATGFTSASYGGQSGTVEEFDAAMKDAEAKYMERFAEYQARRSESEIAIAAWELQPESSRGEKPKTPTAPSRPNLMTNTVQTNSGFARAIALALKEAKPNKQVAITLSDTAKIVIEGEEVVWKDEKNNQWYATLRMGDQKTGLSWGSGLKATDSSKLVQDLTPANIAQDIERTLRNAKDQIADLDARKAGNERRAKLEVDTSKRDAAQAELRWYEQQVRFAEIESDVRRSSRPNRYIERDRRRPLGQMARVELAEVQNFEIDGEAYTTTGVQDGSGSYMNMQATRDSDGLPAVVQIRTVASGKNETTTSVLLQPSSIKFKPKLGKSTNLKQTGAPEGNDTDVVFNRRDDAPFYSALSREVDAIPAKAQGAVGWAMNIAGLVKAGKVKQDEVEWSGVLDWLKMQEGKVTREQLVQFLAANGVQVEETVLEGGAKYKPMELDSILDQWAARNPGPVADAIVSGEPWEVTKRLAQKHGEPDVVRLIDGREDNTKYASYQLPGGTMYREVLLTMPEPDRLAKAKQAGFTAVKDSYGWQILNPQGEGVGSGKGETADQALESWAKLSVKDSGGHSFRSDHWDQPNILAHIRVNDRTDANGKKVLFVEEIQSDWAQTGKKQGFGQKAHQWEIREEVEDGETWFNLYKDGEFEIGAKSRSSAEEQMRNYQAATSARAVPPAPFVTKTDAWLSLALKRIVKMAVDGGYDRVAFISGDQSAERYSLSQQVKSIKWQTVGVMGDREVDIQTKDGRLQFKVDDEGTIQPGSALGETRALDGKKLDDTLGKDMAKRILTERSGNLSGEGLNIGGGGMRAFYDKIVPNTLKDVLRKVGGGALETVSLQTTKDAGSWQIVDATDEGGRQVLSQDFPTRDAAERALGAYDGGVEIEQVQSVGTQPGFTITDAMRERAAGGLPMFAQTAYTGANDQAPSTRDTGPHADRNIGYLDRAINRHLGAKGTEAAPFEPVVIRDQAALQRIAAAFNATVQGFRTRPAVLATGTREYEFFNGTFTNGLTFIRDRTDRPHLAILGHETAHQMARTNPALYAKLVAAIRPYVDQKKYRTGFANSPVARGVSTDQQALQEEFVGEVLSDGFMDADFWRAVGKSNPNLLQSIGHLVTRLVRAVLASVGVTKRTEPYLSDFKAVMKIAGEVMGEYGIQVPTQSGGGIAFNRVDSAMSLSGITDTLKQATSPIGTVSLWDKTVGTQYHKATKDADFKRVFDGFVQQTDDTAHYAIEAERLAPGILMRLESVGDVANAMKNFSPRYAARQKADLAAVAKALFANIEGETGVKQVRYDERSLREIFDLTPKQIEMYYQARAAVDQSIERLAQTFAAQMGRDQGMDIERVKNYDLDDTVAMVKTHIQDEHDEQRAAYENARQMLSEITPEDEAADETAAELAKQLRKVPKGPSKAETARQLEQLDLMVEHARFLQENAYMPAMRFGEFAVTVTDPDGEIQHFEMFESKLAANLAAIRLGKEYSGSKVTKSVMNPQQYAMFKGVSPETVELFAKFTGMDQNDAYRDYIALAKSARSVKVRELQRKGIAGFSEDITRVMASFITSNARQAAINVNSGEINDAMASKSMARKGDVQREAQKLHDYMNNPQEEARRLRGFMFMHFIGGSIASAIVNMTQPVLQTAPYLSQFAKGKTARIMAQAAKMATTGKIEDKELRAAAKRAAEDGITEPHEIHQLMADAGDPGSGELLEKATFGVLTPMRVRVAVKTWGGFFSLAEAYNRRLTFIAAYQTAQETGQADPYEFARKAVIETQGLYAKANRPNWARGGVGATIFTFKQFSIGYVEFILRMPRKQKIIALAVLVMLAGVQGLPFAEDAEDVIDTIGQSLGYNTNSKRWARQFLNETFGQTLGEILDTGILSQSGIDVHGRLSMGNLLPGTALFLPSETDKTRTLSEFAGPLGGLVVAFQKALGSAQRGDFLAAGREMAPTAVKNLLQGAEMARTGVYKDSRGYKVSDVDAADSFYKMLGFQPGTVARLTRKLSDAVQDKNMVTMMEAMIADRWAAGLAEKDTEQVAKARATLKAWNENNPAFRIVITPGQILSRVRKINQTRQERFIKTAPLEVRRTLAKELQ